MGIENENINGSIDGADAGNSDRAIADIGEVSRSMFAMLDKPTQIHIIVGTYFGCFVLGVALAVLAFWFEYQAQIHHNAFEMRDWMIALLFTLLSLPVVGAWWGAKKK